MPIEFTVSDVVSATPQEVYEAWLSSDGHTEMTGGEAHASDSVGAKFDAWDGYISGKNLELAPGKRIVQSWRTTEFKKSEPDSRIEVTLEAVTGGTKVTLRHLNIPDDGGHYEQGWHDHYFEPMKERFGS
jgi:uncharacterized protein YndB with AHSA1/START domain